MVSKVTFKLPIPLGKGVRDKASIKQEIGDFIKESILNDVGGSTSPVTGRGFVKLNEKYAKRKGKVASPIPNLELSGNMLDALEFQINSRGIEIGIFDEGEAQKADNHNKFSSDSQKTGVPARKFIPNRENGETFRPDIRDGILGILKRNEVDSKQLKSVREKFRK